MQISSKELMQLRQESVQMAKERLEAVSDLPKPATELIVGIIEDIFQRLKGGLESSVAATTYHETTMPAENLRLDEPANDTAEAGMQFDAQPQGIISQNDPPLFEGVDYKESLDDFLDRKDLVNNGGFTANGDFVNNQDFATNGGFTDNGNFASYDLNNGEFDNQYPWGPTHPQ